MGQPVQVTCAAVVLGLIDHGDSGLGQGMSSGGELALLGAVLLGAADRVGECAIALGGGGDQLCGTSGSSA